MHMLLQSSWNKQIPEELIKKSEYSELGFRHMWKVMWKYTNNYKQTSLSTSNVHGLAKQIKYIITFIKIDQRNFQANTFFNDWQFFIAVVY